MMRRSTALIAPLAALFLAACQPQQPQMIVVEQPPTRACDTRFRVTNYSSQTVAQLFFSHSSQSNWGADQLGASVLPPGRHVNYAAANAGDYDFRVVWVSGRAAELRRVNICAASEISVTDAGLRAR